MMCLFNKNKNKLYFCEYCLRTDYLKHKHKTIYWPKPYPIIYPPNPQL